MCLCPRCARGVRKAWGAGVGLRGFIHSIIEFDSLGLSLTCFIEIVLFF